jgi:hypothetical protein
MLLRASIGICVLVVMLFGNGFRLALFMRRFGVGGVEPSISPQLSAPQRPGIRILKLSRHILLRS